MRLSVLVAPLLGIVATCPFIAHAQVAGMPPATLTVPGLARLQIPGGTARVIGGDGSFDLVMPTGSTTPSAVNDWMMRRCRSPEDYRKNTDGSTATDTQAMQATINAAQNGGAGCVFVPAKTYVLSPVTIAGNNLTIQCAASGGPAGGGTKFLAADLTSTMFTVGIVSGVFFRNCSWASASQQTAGSYVDFEGGNSLGLADAFMSGGYNPLVMNNTNVVHVDHLRLSNSANNAITIGGGNPGVGAGVNGGGGDQYFYDIIADNDTTVSPNSGFYITQSGGSITISSSDILHSHNAIWVNPGAGQFVSWIYSINAYLDSCDYASNLRGGVGLLVTPHDGAIANGGNFTSLWASTCSISAKLVGDAASILSDYHLTDSRMVHSYGDGIDIDYADNIFITTPTISGGSTTSPGVSNGLSLGTHATQISLTGGGHIGPSENYAATFGYNLYLAPGFAGALTVEGVNLNGAATAPVFDGATASAPVLIRDASGYNPRGPAVITPTGSPYTYNAGRSPEMISVVNGTVSTVTAGGAAGVVTVCGASPCYVRLVPEQQMTVTYSVAPYMATNRE